MKKLLALLLLLALGSPVLAQGTFPLNNLPLGKGPGKTGFTPLAPGADGTCLVVASGVPTFTTCSPTAPGGSNLQIQYNNAGAFGGLTDTQVTARINSFTSSLSGAVPASGGGTTNFLRADGTFAAPPNNTTGVIPTTATVTISNASPGVVTWTAHGLSANAVVYFCTTGSLPTGLTPCVPATGTVSANTYASNPTLYYVKTVLTANTFTVSATSGGAAINTSSAGSGTHTAFANAMACAGCVGEYVYTTRELATGSALAAVSGSAGQVVNSISLTAGIWRVWGNTGVIKINAGTPVFSHLHSGIVYGFSTIPTSPYNGTTASHITSNDPNGWMHTNAPEIIVLTGTTTINQTATTDFAPTTANTAGLYGSLKAERER